MNCNLVSVLVFLTPPIRLGHTDGGRALTNFRQRPLPPFFVRFAAHFYVRRLYPFLFSLSVSSSLSPATNTNAKQFSSTFHYSWTSKRTNRSTQIFIDLYCYKITAKLNFVFFFFPLQIFLSYTK